MKRITISLICTLIMSVSLTSCLPEAEETELTSTVALLSFSINDLKTKHTLTLDNGKDTTYTTIMKGNAIKFAIDHEQGKVYNPSPIAYGTDITRVTTSLSADGYVQYVHPETKEKTGYSAEDSIDFTNPVLFTITSHDEKFTRDYLISLNIYKADPTTTQWEQLTPTNLPAGHFTKVEAIIRDGQLYLFGKDNEGKAYTATTPTTSGIQWTGPEAWTGIDNTAPQLDIIQHGQYFYTLADGQLYRSADGIHWQTTETTETLTALIGVTTETTPTVWAIKGDTLVASTDLVRWESYGQTLTHVPHGRISCISSPLRTNPNIHRTLFVANATDSDNYAQVWSKLSTEKEWTEVIPDAQNSYGCPNLEDLTVITYRNRMYAFGGNSLGQQTKPTEPYSACYESRDNGVTWRIRDNALSLHHSFAGRTEPCATVVDDNHRVWMIWATTGEVWQGTWRGE